MKTTQYNRLHPIPWNSGRSNKIKVILFLEPLLFFHLFSSHVRTMFNANKLTDSILFGIQNLLIKVTKEIVMSSILGNNLMAIEIP